jgi:hypothetical protein
LFDPSDADWIDLVRQKALILIFVQPVRQLAWRHFAVASARIWSQFFESEGSMSFP